MKVLFERVKEGENIDGKITKLGIYYPGDSYDSIIRRFHEWVMVLK